MSIPPEKLEKQARSFIDIQKNLNKITSIQAEYSIDSEDNLRRHYDQQIFDALCFQLVTVYEIYAVLCVKNNQQYKPLRNYLAHYREDGYKEPGVNNIDLNILWNQHIIGAIPTISTTITEKLKSEELLHAKVIEFSSDRLKPPIQLLDKNDYSHLTTFKKIGDSVKEVAIPLLGILYTMLGDPPTKQDLRSVILKILPSKKDRHFDFIVGELEDEGILYHSESGNFVLIKNQELAKNTTRDFLENYNIKELLEAWEAANG